MVKEPLRSLGYNIGIEIQPVFGSKPIQQILWPKEKKPDLVNNQSVVYHFKEARDTVRVIISRQTLARVLSTQYRFLTSHFPPK